MTIQMMIEFQDEDMAKQFAKEYFMGKDPNSGATILGSQHYDIIGAYKKPEMFCHCPGANGYSYGQVYGFWVHPRCNAPSTYSHGYVEDRKNMIPESLIPDYVPRQHIRSGSKYEWGFLVDGEQSSSTGY